MASNRLTPEAKAQLIPIIDSILFASDLSTVSVKKVRNGLAAQADCDVVLQKKEIDFLITERFDKVLAEKEAANEDEIEENEDDDEGDVNNEDAEETTEPESAGSVSTSISASSVTSKKRKPTTVDEDARIAAELHAALNGGRPSRSTAASKKKVQVKAKKPKKKSKASVDSDGSGEETPDKPEKKKRKVNPNSPFMAPLILSEPLAALLGESQLSRPQTVKRIWAYVKEHNLQDPSDGRYILCDDQMKPIFGNKVHMCTMNKVLSQNMYKPGE